MQEYYQKTKRLHYLNVKDYSCTDFASCVFRHLFIILLYNSFTVVDPEINVWVCSEVSFPCFRSQWCRMPPLCSPHPFTVLKGWGSCLFDLASTQPSPRIYAMYRCVCVYLHTCCLCALASCLSVSF